ncbi:PREDICTED: interleukin-37 isoform X4 [Colobus angolensis palliatus]|uniref:interleukin-37 isoform X4 n=1 Tax=Colobus angolensis palliatus TaxID=336983 RepID=UPI0005F501E3|nr:PREDICTED: interleukin-37 isoform X4 [Colobus angolensis palliatus]
MSFVGENSGVKMGSEDWEKDEPQIHTCSDCLFPEIFFALASSLSSASAEKGSPILLGVSKGEFCLSCDKDKGQSHPSLQLKKKKLMKLAALKESARRPFIFYRAQVGSRNMLESAAHPGWFICTSCNCNEPVGVTDKFENRKHIEFSFQPVCKAEMSPSKVSD